MHKVHLKLGIARLQDQHNIITYKITYFLGSQIVKISNFF